MADWKHERARVAALTRSRKSNDPELIEARRNLKSIRLNLYVSEINKDGSGLPSETAGAVALMLLQGGDK